MYMYGVYRGMPNAFIAFIATCPTRFQIKPALFITFPSLLTFIGRVTVMVSIVVPILWLLRLKGKENNVLD
jgi:hypothetical protein